MIFLFSLFFFLSSLFLPIRREKNKVVTKVVLKWMSKYHYSFQNLSKTIKVVSSSVWQTWLNSQRTPQIQTKKVLQTLNQALHNQAIFIQEMKSESLAIMEVKKYLFFQFYALFINLNLVLFIFEVEDSFDFVTCKHANIMHQIKKNMSLVMFGWKGIERSGTIIHLN